MSVSRMSQLVAVGVLSTAATFGLAGAAQAADATPASAAFSSTCDGVHAVFTSASDHATEFDVATPAGGSDTVAGSATRDYAADAADAQLSVTYDGNSESYDWTDPGNCASPAQADPQVSASNECVTGINVTLSNINGSATASFILTQPGGSARTVNVRSGQIKRYNFPVQEDSTGEVTVSATGLAPQTFTYHKDCASVLGVKQVRQPSTTPSTGGASESGGTATGQAELPFTGFASGQTATGGVLLVGLGLSMCMAGRRRRGVSCPDGD